MDKKIIQKKGRYFTEKEKRLIIEELILNQCTKQEIWEKYTGKDEEHGQLLRWMRKIPLHPMEASPQMPAKAEMVLKGEL